VNKAGRSYIGGFVAVAASNSAALTADARLCSLYGRYYSDVRASDIERSIRVTMIRRRLEDIK